MKFCFGRKRRGSGKSPKKSGPIKESQFKSKREKKESKTKVHVIETPKTTDLYDARLVQTRSHKTSNELVLEPKKAEATVSSKIFFRLILSVTVL